MERRKLGDLEVSAVGLGCATMTPFYGEPDPAEAVAAIRRARELGIDFLDTSDAYGAGRNEELIARAVEPHRGDYAIASKFGNLRGADGRPTANGRPEYVREACDQSLKRLKTDVIDLYYIHRVDPAVPIEDVAGAVGELIQAGKVRHFGLSEAAPGTIRRAHAVCPVTAVQSEYSLWTRDPEAGVLAACQELGIGFVPFSPLGKGFLTGTVNTATEFAPGDIRTTIPRFTAPNRAANQALVEHVTALARARGATPGQVALAWLLAQHRQIVPIPGTRRRERLAENATATGVALSADEVTDLNGTAARIGVHGNRYNEQHMSLVGR
jgi:aryl-alcohol dehydrogenase-like predicted oxidoreductase